MRGLLLATLLALLPLLTLGLLGTPWPPPYCGCFSLCLRCLGASPSLSQNRASMQSV